jgi:hypothetical protein
MPGITTSPDRPLAQKVAFVKSGRSERLAVLLRDGRLVAVPLQLYPTLKSAAPAARRSWRLIGRGQGIHWPDLDLDLSTEGIVNARPDRTRGAWSRASEREMAQMVLKSVAESDEPISVAELARLLERALPPAKVRDVVARLQRTSRRSRRGKAGRSAPRDA